MIDGPRIEAQAVQRFHIRLLYSAPLIDAYLDAPERVLAAHGIGAAWQHRLPDPGTVGFKVEFHGRRMQIFSELQHTFAATLGHLSVADVAPAEQRWLAEFLASDHFFLAKHSLPDVTRVGRGYEVTSRFFFWARDQIAAGTLGREEALKDDLHLDFACWLDQIAHRTSNPDWERFRHGCYWTLDRPGAGRVRMLTAQRKVETWGADEASARLPRMLSLETLVP